MPTAGKKSRVVVDTNVFISGLHYPGKPRKILELLRQGRIECYISPFILRELERILREKFGWSKPNTEAVLVFLRQHTIEVEPRRTVSVIHEKEDDNRILECSLEGKVHYIISGDKRHLLRLKKFRGIKIVSPAEFLGLLFAS